MAANKRVRGAAAPGAASTAAPDRTRGAAVRALVRDMCRACSVHGVRYLAPHHGASPAARLAWLLAVAGSVWLCGLVCQSAWRGYSRAPAAMQVESTHWPLHGLHFPAVTLCPGLRVRKHVALPLLARELGEDAGSLNGSLRASLLHVLSALSLFRQPLYEGVTTQLNAAGGPLLRRLAGLNVTSFMLQVLPRCETVLQRCFFQGAPLNCCREFSLQRAPVGFCYSFNSLTSEARRHCNTNDPRAECRLRRGAASGEATGLEVFLHRDPASSDGVLRVDPPGSRVTVHGPRDAPGLGLVAPQWAAGGERSVAALAVDAALITSSAQLRSLAPASRLCLFSDEWPLLTSRFYSRANCVQECLHTHLASRCGCLPYFAHVPSAPWPECNLEQMKCIVQVSGERRRGGGGCGRCLPDCEEAVYQAQAAVARDCNPAGAATAAYLDVHYSHSYAIKYRRVLTFDTRQLIVYLGGIASLFLGVSLLSGVELVYWAARIVVAAARRPPPAQSTASHPATLTAPPNIPPPCLAGHHNVNRAWIE